MTAVLAALPALLGLILAGLQAYLAASPQRKTQEVIDDDKALRQACLELDAAAITQRIDRVLNGVLHPAGNRVTK